MRADPQQPRPPGSRVPRPPAPGDSDPAMRRAISSVASSIVAWLDTGDCRAVGEADDHPLVGRGDAPAHSARERRRRCRADRELPRQGGGPSRTRAVLESASRCANAQRDAVADRREIDDRHGDRGVARRDLRRRGDSGHASVEVQRQDARALRASPDSRMRRETHRGSAAMSSRSRLRRIRS